MAVNLQIPGHLFFFFLHRPLLPTSTLHGIRFLLVCSVSVACPPLSSSPGSTSKFRAAVSSFETSPMRFRAAIAVKNKYHHVSMSPFLFPVSMYFSLWIKVPSSSCPYETDTDLSLAASLPLSLARPHSGAAPSQARQSPYTRRLQLHATILRVHPNTLWPLLYGILSPPLLSQRASRGHWCGQRIFPSKHGQ